jgi:hypothetical protein
MQSIGLGTIAWNGRLKANARTFCMPSATLSDGNEFIMIPPAKCGKGKDMVTQCDGGSVEKMMQLCRTPKNASF